MRGMGWGRGRDGDGDSCDAERPLIQWAEKQDMIDKYRCRRNGHDTLFSSFFFIQELELFRLLLLADFAKIRSSNLRLLLLDQ